MGVTYIGPVDGHNIDELIRITEDALKIEHPVLIHVLTKKGKGYLPAENNPTKFHGIDSFDVKTGEKINESNVKTYTDIFSDKILELGNENKNIVAITAAMPDGTGLKKFGDKYPDKFFDVGIAEEHAVTFAAGLAANGKKPFISIYSSFYQRAYDQIIHDVCLQNLPVTFIVDRAGLVGKDGETHQGIFDISFFSNIPNMTIIAPKNGRELEKALDKIFGDETTEIKTFAQENDLKVLKKDAPAEPVQPLEEIKPESIQPENQMETIDTPVVEPLEETKSEEVKEEVKKAEIPVVAVETTDLKDVFDDFNSKLEDANKIEGEDIEDIDYNLDDLRKSLRETEKLPTLYIQRTLRSGQSISSDGNIVIIGDANPGSEIIAKGDITVWGVLGGIAHAGSAGNQYAKIRALKMNAIQLRIADTFARRPDNINIPYIQKTDTFIPEEACIYKKQIIIHKIHES